MMLKLILNELASPCILQVFINLHLRLSLNRVQPFLATYIWPMPLSI